MLSVQTNKYHLMVQRAQNQAQHELDTSFKRLSSGSRINSAADDAAGLQITDRLSKAITAGRQVNRNLADGVSYAQIAEAGLSQITDTLQRMRQLSVQAQNGVNSAEDRAALDKEFQQLKAHIDSVAFGTVAFQKLPLVGNDDISSDVPRIDELLQQGVTIGLPSGLRSIAYIPAGSEGLSFLLNDNGANDDIQVFSRDGKHLVGSPLSAQTWSANGISVPADLQDNFFFVENGYLANPTYDDSNLNQAGTSNYNGMEFVFSGDSNPTSLVETLTIDRTTEPLIVSVIGSGFFNITGDWTTIGEQTAQGLGGLDTGSVRITSSLRLENESDYNEIMNTPATVKALGLSDVSVDNPEAAAAALSAMDRALANATSKQSYYGAKLNQMQSAQRSATMAVESTSSARSRIQDTDFAIETANLVKNQILNDTSLAVLSQANAIPEQIFSLLSASTNRG
ncbi:flagellin N-terminal helical domain-containing protein [Aliidiomarina celeris]|uniref:flagellin N-terminal helical domain-containing protein n=1 Tax=Aliidiomarina celeris TaxID=2249428 RepID=UPI000DE9EB6F|nr:flagellin [Aliidiomarina celeris]